jgi:predicted RNA binding protein YcfA (HicA-like mRNA interferase family)
VKYSELEKLLLEAGCKPMRKGGNHPLWKSPITGKMFPMSNYHGQEVKQGTLKSIIKSSGVKFNPI